MRLKEVQHTFNSGLLIPVEIVELATKEDTRSRLFYVQHASIFYGHVGNCRI
jgi:hypothetical protein